MHMELTNWLNPSPSKGVVEISNDDANRLAKLAESRLATQKHKHLDKLGPVTTSLVTQHYPVTNDGPMADFAAYKLRTSETERNKVLLTQNHGLEVVGETSKLLEGPLEKERIAIATQHEKVERMRTELSGLGQRILQAEHVRASQGQPAFSSQDEFYAGEYKQTDTEVGALVGQRDKLKLKLDLEDRILALMKKDHASALERQEALVRDTESQRRFAQLN